MSVAEHVSDDESSAARDFARVESAIRYLDACAEDQPRLAEVAAHVGLSESHFQRVFQRWAGVSPKRFLQYVTAAHVRELLAGSAPLLEVAFEAGLSGPGRLHDLVVAVHAMTPGELRAGGAGLTLRHGFHDTPFGACLLGATERGVCVLSFVEPGDEASELATLRARFPGARLVEDAAGTAPQVAAIFGASTSRSVPTEGQAPRLALHVAGTNFQLRVWEALLRIPPGAVTTYGAIARELGLERGARAVGGAVAANPVGYLIPCHRVIRGTAAFGEYRWGATRKRAMLGLESARRTRG